MKKDLLFSLIAILIVFAGITGNMVYQSHSFHYKTYRFNHNVQRRSVIFFENRMAHKLMNEENHDKIISLSETGDQNKKGCDILAEQTGGAGIISERLDFEFTKFWGRNLANYHTISVSQKTEG